MEDLAKRIDMSCYEMLRNHGFRTTNCRTCKKARTKLKKQLKRRGYELQNISDSKTMTFVCRLYKGDELIDKRVFKFITKGGDDNAGAEG